MELTAGQIRHCRRGLVEWPEGTAGEDLAAAVCDLLSSLPDVRADVVATARERLSTLGPPTAAVLADMLIGELAGASTL